MADNGVYYAEMGSDRVLHYSAGRTRIVWSARGCGPTSVAEYAAELVVLCHRAGAVVTLSRNGEVQTILEEDESGRRVVTPNASTSDRRGGVYISSSGAFSPNAKATGAVLYLDAEGQLHRVAEGIHYANGLALSADGGTLYVSEHLGRNILAYRVKADGSLSAPALYLALDALAAPDSVDRNWDVGPDGLAVDSQGNLYIAEYGAGRLLVVAPDRTLLATITVDEKYITAPALSLDQRTLFITAPSARDPSKAGKVYELPNPVHPVE